MKCKDMLHKYLNKKAKALKESTDLTKSQIKKVHKVVDELPKKDLEIDMVML